MSASTLTYTLLIWEEIPESIKLVLIPNDVLGKNDLKIFRQVHGKYINSTETSKADEKALDRINNALCSVPEHLGKDHPIGSKWAMRFKDYIRPNEVPIEDENITRVFRMGFFL